jgi:hypothetical protein
MKLNKLFFGAAVVFAAFTAKADYQLLFNTFNDAVNPTNPVFDTDGTTVLRGVNGFVGQLYAGTSAGSLSSIGSPVAFLNGTTAATGGGNISGGTATKPDAGVTSATAGFYQFRVWNTANGSTYEAASAVIGAKIGSSTVQAVTLQGYANGTTPPISFPTANLHGSFALTTVVVPEPATIALGLFGAAGLFVRRRK